MQNFEQFLIEQGVVGYKDEPVTFKSGKQSHCYINCRVLSQSLSTLETTSLFVVDFLKTNNLVPSDLDAVLGVPEGATELGNAVSRKLIQEKLLPDRIFLQRVKSKEHGDIANKCWINGNVPRKVIVLEDVTTTGGSAIEYIQKLRDSGVEVVSVVGLVDRLQLSENGNSVLQNFADIKVEYKSLTNITRILSQDSSLTAAQKEVILKGYRKEYEAFDKVCPV
jgi:orotate phosphoribosyltransferase